MIPTEDPTKHIQIKLELIWRNIKYEVEPIIRPRNKLPILFTKYYYYLYYSIILN
jgi:hypothetical protein